jgi:hypothetical protein
MSIESSHVRLGGTSLRGRRIFPGVNVMSNHLDEHHLPVDSAAFYSIANRKLVV